MLSLFAMCTAPALIPIFLGMTEQMTEARRKRTAFGVALTVTLALAFMIFFGLGCVSRIVLPTKP